MRLTASEQGAIRQTVANYDQQAKVYLFGSRVDDAKKGGDIDLLVISPRLGFAEKLNILADLHEQLGDQKIDLLLDKDGGGEFTQTILPGAVEIN
ncbi:nucleotidyltransferase domain-containing protein [Pelagibaculum spongiae]|uniref:DNA polymerase III subunit beta n=1 Tax=Pelagibaculum spongiae TaxID=2080658 RepID=A0A2V1H102_9GAMM|nr:nucleotidyltransferase domain-containing protein [Pelagibaculum spongiae]PVZ71640.1 DNA polymerase III subunit beta [Pelagibaculum spongiae]